MEDKKYLDFVKKAEELSFFSHKMKQHKADYENKITNCYGFCTHLFPFLGKARDGRYVAVKMAISDDVFLKEIQEPEDYCFIFIPSELNGLYTHIAVFVKGKVFEIYSKGYRVSDFKNFQKEHKKMSYFFVYNEQNENLNLKQNFN